MIVELLERARPLRAHDEAAEGKVAVDEERLKFLVGAARLMVDPEAIEDELRIGRVRVHRAPREAATDEQHHSKRQLLHGAIAGVAPKTIEASIRDQKHVHDGIRLLRRFDGIANIQLATLVFTIGKQDHGFASDLVGQLVMSR